MYELNCSGCVVFKIVSLSSVVSISSSPISACVHSFVPIHRCERGLGGEETTEVEPRSVWIVGMGLSEGEGGGGQVGIMTGVRKTGFMSV